MTDIPGLLARLRSACLDIETGEPLDSDARPDIHVDDVRAVLALLTAVPESLETTAEDRRAWATTGQTIAGRLVRDIDRLSAALAAEKKRADAAAIGMVDQAIASARWRAEAHELAERALPAGEGEYVCFTRGRFEEMVKEKATSEAALAAEKARAEAAEARLAEAEKALRSARDNTQAGVEHYASADSRASTVVGYLEELVIDLDAALTPIPEKPNGP